MAAMQLCCAAAAVGQWLPAADDSIIHDDALILLAPSLAAFFITTPLPWSDYPIAVTLISSVLAACETHPDSGLCYCHNADYTVITHHRASSRSSNVYHVALQSVRNCREQEELTI